MAANPTVEDTDSGQISQAPEPDLVAGGAMSHPLTAAAIVGGVIAAGAGAYLGTRALARRNGAGDGKPVSSVMANAITASDVNSGKEG